MSNLPSQTELRERLIAAAGEKTLDAQFIKDLFRLDTLPNVTKDAIAYVNWSTTLVVEGPAPAQVYFAGVRKPDPPPEPDRIRDAQSVGTYYWWVDIVAIRKNEDAVYTFSVRQTDRPGMLYIDIMAPNGQTVAVFDGTPTQRACTNELVTGRLEFNGKGLWGLVGRK